jgi:SpoIID/LytB domain protein
LFRLARVPLAVLALALCVPALLGDKPAAPTAAQMTTLPATVRVLLKTGSEPISVGGELQWLNGTKVLGTTTVATELALVDNQVRLRLNGKAADAPRFVAIPLSGYAVYGGKSYRGRFELYVDDKARLCLINVLPLEDYLCGVVPGEMPAAWPEDALRAQAVAARTYTARRMLDQRDNDWDVLPTVADQVYLGVSAEKPTTNQAVLDTASEILLYEGQPISANYCSDAGGCTAPGQFPYLQPVYSYAPESKHNRWEVPLTLDSLAALAMTQSVDVGKPQAVRTENDAVSGHLLKLTLTGDNSHWSLGGKELRKLLGLTKMRSTRARLYAANEAGEPPPPVEAADDGRALKCFPSGTLMASAKAGGRTAEGRSSVAATGLITQFTTADAKAGLVLVGCGNGHGVGMSQYGAAELAKQGMGYRDILLYFYRGVELVKLGTAVGSAAAGDDVDVELKPAPRPAPSLGGKKDEFYKPFKPKS